MKNVRGTRKLLLLLLIFSFSFFVFVFWFIIIIIFNFNLILFYYILYYWTMASPSPPTTFTRRALQTEPEFPWNQLCAAPGSLACFVAAWLLRSAL